MIRTADRAKIVAFVAVTLLGIGYVLLRYLGVGQAVLGRQFTAYADLSDSGGLFTSASVTYRGIEIGRVGSIELRPGGIRVALVLDGRYRIPADVHAVVGNGSAIGEQYIDLEPSTRTGPYLHAGSVIPQSRTALPVSVQQMLVSVDRLVRSVPPDKLRTLITELGTGFAGTGPQLQRLLDASHQLLAAATANLPTTTALIDQSGPVLDTQNALAGDILGFAHHLAAFSDQLRRSNGDLTRVLTAGTGAAGQLTGLDRALDATLPVTLANLNSLAQVTAPRVPALRQLLIGYPYVIATTFGLFPGDGTVRFGAPLGADENPQPCTQGYLPPSQHRLPSELNYPPFRWGVQCKAPTNSGYLPRGPAEAPEPDGRRLGDEPYYRNNDGLPQTGSGGQTSTTANSTEGPSWLALILDPLTQ